MKVVFQTKAVSRSQDFRFPDRKDTGRVTLEGETYLIINHKEGSIEAIEINFKKKLIKSYDDDSWTFLPMDSGQQFDPEARLISHIDQLKR